MNIQNPSSTGPARSNPLRSNETNESAAGAASSPEEQAATPAQVREASDRIEISNSAREAQSGGANAADALLVERGREALQGSSLSEGRLTELKQRASEGYYSTPEATQQIAEGLAEEASGA